MDTVNVMGVPDTARRATEEDRVEPEPDTYFDGWRDEGHQRLCRTVRHELEQHGPAWARSIDDEALLDPLLVTTTSHPDSGLELPQCLWGLVPPRHRPSSMSVRAFEDGRVLLPGLGTLRGPEPFGRATLHVVDDEPRLREHPDARLEPLPRAGPIVVYPYRHPWLRPYTDLHGKHYADTRVEEPTRHNLSSLTEAMELLEATSPRQHAELGRDLRLAIIVHQPALASMAGLPIHGAVFLSVRGHESLLGESTLSVFAAPALAARLQGGFPRLLDGAPFLLPGEDVAHRGALLQWFERMRIRPAIVAEFDDSALMKAFGQAGDGVFAAPTTIADYVCRQYGVRLLGEVPDARARVYAITTERRLLHPAMQAIRNAAARALTPAPPG